MNILKEDIISLLKYYVERETEEEKKLIEDQIACGLTVCLNVHYVNNDIEKNVIVVHTQLNQSIETEENITESGGHLDHFYIKSQKVSHQTKKSSSNSYCNDEIITTETIVTKSLNKCEIVYKTYLHKTDSGNLQQSQRLFIREIIKMKNNEELERPLSRVQEWDNHSNVFLNDNMRVEDVDNISKNIITNGKNEKPKLKKMTSIKRLKSFIMKKDVDNNKKNILNAEKLEPIKKPRKSIKRKLKDWFNRSIIVTPDKPILTNTKKKSFAELKKYISTEDSEMEKEKPTNIIARISMDSETKNFEIVKDNLLYADEENNDSVELSTSEFHCYFRFSNLTENNSKNEMEKCNCIKRCQEAILSYILSRLNKTKLDEEEINKFDEETRHFRDCSYSKTFATNRRVSSKLSTVSSPNSLSPFENNTVSRGRRGSVISVNSEYRLDIVFDRMKFSSDIDCPKETINYFINSKTYEHYENGLLNVLDTNISLENMILLFYLTRIIVTQIDDPTCDDNDDIKRIIEFSEKYLIKQYYDEISSHGNLERFIMRCDSID